MDSNLVFNRAVRSGLIEIPIGKQGRAFDRLELESAAEEYIRRNGRLAAARRKPWDETEGVCQVSRDVTRSDTSTKSSTERAFAKALAQATSRNKGDLLWRERQIYQSRSQLAIEHIGIAVVCMRYAQGGTTPGPLCDSCDCIEIGSSRPSFGEGTGDRYRL